MIGILGKKVGMTQIFDEDGRRIPVTLIEAGPCHITSVRTKDKNGYAAVQLAFDPMREKRSTKARVGHLKKAGAPALRFVREIRTEDLQGLAIGGQVRVDNFEAGDFVDVVGISIGKGFQGAVKRHHFKGALTMSHGDMHGRRVGSIGASSFPSRVVKGMRAPGHMGDERITVQNLKVIKVDLESNILAVRGAVPGIEGGYLVVRAALKKGARRNWKVQGGSQESSKEAPTQEAKPAAEAAGKPKES